MKKKYLFMATAAIMMAGCASDDLVGDETVSQNGDHAIGFSMNTPAMTRDGESNATDAGKLGNMFIVWGEKNESDKSSTKYKVSAPSDVDLVFNNYRVDYKASTAGTTLSNTENWEYVGDSSFVAKVTPSAPESQTIKYWDMNAKDYTFTAVSAPAGEVGSKIKITKITESNSTTASVYDKGYTIELADASASVGKIYVADREHLTKAANSQSGTINRTAENVYGGQVKLTFRNFQSKIRFGIYETVPGYKVVITGIRYNTDNNASPTTVTHPLTTGNEGNTTTDNTFGITGDFVKAGSNTQGSNTYNTTYTVTYRSDSGHEGEAQVSINDNATKATYLTTAGTTWLTTTAGIGTKASEPTYDNGASGDYTPILPNTKNSTNLKLQIAYKLISEDTGEVIEFKESDGTTVKYRTVEVPASYCQWKSNYAYTYLFKISDKSAELYPITFDACVVETQIGDQETITEVSEPSITTMGVGTDNKVITGKDEYSAGSTIYASVVDGTTNTTGGAVALTATTNINLYTVATTNTNKTTITEAAVANCLAQKKYNTSLTSPSSPYEITDLNGYKLTVTSVEIKTSGTTDPIIVNKVPTEEGLEDATRDLNALKWTATGSTSEDTYYVVEYIKTDSSNQSKTYYKVIKVAKGS